MEANPAVSTGQLDRADKRWLRLRSLPKVKRNPLPFKGGEVELLQQLGELPRQPSDLGVPVDRTLARWRWM
jgi:hypothetical protein